MPNRKELGLVTYPVIVTEQYGEVNVGRMVLPVAASTMWEANPAFLRFFNALGNQQQLETPKPRVDLRGSLLFSLNNNTPNQHEAISHYKPVSAYFTYNPGDETVIVEWGTVNKATGNAKLHTYLNQVIDYPDRIRQGMKLSSGHIARIKGEEYAHLALIDSLPSAHTRIHRDDPMGKLVNTLHAGNFIPIAGDGTVRLPAFVADE